MTFCLAGSVCVYGVCRSVVPVDMLTACILLYVNNNNNNVIGVCIYSTYGSWPEASVLWDRMGVGCGSP